MDINFDESRAGKNGSNGISGQRMRDAMVKTRKSFAGYAVFHLKEMGKNDLAACYMGKWSIYEKQPWSSIHDGFIEYLTPTLKARFFAVPER